MKAITNEDVMNEHMEKLGINEDDTILDFGYVMNYILFLLLKC